MRALIGRLPESEPVLLRNFSVFLMCGENYPAAVPQRGGKITGIIYSGLTPAELKKLDKYEGDEYLRQRQQVTPVSGDRITAWVYILKPAYRARLSNKPWGHGDAEESIYPQINADGRRL